MYSFFFSFDGLVNSPSDSKSSSDFDLDKGGLDLFLTFLGTGLGSEGLGVASGTGIGSGAGVGGDVLTGTGFASEEIVASGEEVGVVFGVGSGVGAGVGAGAGKDEGTGVLSVGYSLLLAPPLAINSSIILSLWSLLSFLCCLLHFLISLL